MIINPIISASGGLKPQIVVTAPTGSTVTCTTPGGIVIQGIEISGTWAFANLPGLGTYTINASLGTQSKTKSVIVDRVGVFEVEIIYRLYLYNLGDECTDVTGGWLYGNYVHAQDVLAGAIRGTGTLTKNETNMVLSMSPINPYRTQIVSAQRIDFAGYTKLCTDAEGANHSIQISSTYEQGCLGELVQTGTAQPTAKPCQAHIVRQQFTVFIPRIGHTAEFIKVENLFTFPRASLLKDHRTA